MNHSEEDFKQRGWPTANRSKPRQAAHSLASSSGASNSSSCPSRAHHKQPDYGNKFHRAALDGYVDMLCEASRHDTNLVARDHHLQLTPTLVAAQCGQLEALRMLVGRGGDPERVTTLGSSALHLAAARNHLNCVSFLVNFGVNMWALDNELHTAKEVASVEQSKEVLEYLDQMMARQSAINTKLVQKLKDKARNAAEKRLKQMRKLQLKAIKQIERDERLLAKMSKKRRLLKAAHSLSDIKLVGRSCTDLSQSGVSLAPDQRDPSSGQSHRGRSGASQTIANFIQQRLQQDLLANSRRERQQQQRDLLANAKGTISTLNSSCPSSSLSSTSGYLSSCSAKSILKSAPAAAATKRPSLLGAGSAPKYSDLVAVKREELREVERKSLETESRYQRGKDAHKSSCSSGSIIASKLRVIGGVSRKVHLKRLLFATSKQADQREQQSDGDAGRTKSMQRARSEPDFGAALRQGEDSDDDEQEDCESDQHDTEHEETVRRRSQQQTVEASRHRDQRVGGHSHGALYMRGTLAPRAPPPPPPPPAPLLSHDDQQQLLLTQCLSQLKLQQQQHEESSSCHSASAAHPFGHSDELLQHQISAGEFPLRPSIIKHQRQQQRLRPAGGTDTDNQLHRPLSSAVDSIGSVSSFAARNRLEMVADRESGAASHRDSSGIEASASNSTARPHRPSRFSCSRSSSSSASDPIQCDTASNSSSLEVSNGADNNNNNNNNNNDSDNFGPDQLRDVKLREFLSENKLADLGDILARERIDFEALMLLDESDLKSLNLLLGPRRKLLNAIEQHKSGSKGQPEEELARRHQKLSMVDTTF